MTPMRAFWSGLLMAALRHFGVEPKGRVQRLYGTLHVFVGDVAGDLDRRGRDHFGLDSQLAQNLEGLGRDARMALHAGADDADLAQVVARAPADAERVLGGLAGLVIFERRGVCL